MTCADPIRRTNTAGPFSRRERRRERGHGQTASHSWPKRIAASDPEYRGRVDRGRRCGTTQTKRIVSNSDDDIMRWMFETEFDALGGRQRSGLFTPRRCGPRSMRSMTRSPPAVKRRASTASGLRPRRRAAYEGRRAPHFRRARQARGHAWRRGGRFSCSVRNRSKTDMGACFVTLVRFDAVLLRCTSSATLRRHHRLPPISGGTCAISTSSATVASTVDMDQIKAALLPHPSPSSTHAASFRIGPSGSISTTRPAASTSPLKGDDLPAPCPVSTS